MIRTSARVSCTLMLLLPTLACVHNRPAADSRSSGAAMGPLRVHPSNPRYFADATGRARLLVGSHTWNNLIEHRKTDESTTFDYAGYLDFLGRLNHNLIRLWTWEMALWGNSRPETKPTFSIAFPLPWLRSGPGTASDDKPKFDLTKFDPEYFRRLRDRTVAARERRIYVSVMLFEGFGMQHSAGSWAGHPFNRQNNINGVDGDVDHDGKGLEVFTLNAPEITALQETYLRKVIDTVGDLDNVLYEISNENHGDSTAWQYHMIRKIREYEATRPMQHPVGMTFQFKGGTNQNLFDSPADWISPNPDGGYKDDPPVADGRKVILSDTDHLWGVGGTVAWVWQSVTRGHHPLFMDPLHKEKGFAFANGKSGENGNASKWDSVRRNMGWALAYAERMDLDRALPSKTLASSGYCLAAADAQYLIFAPGGGAVTVDLGEASGTFSSEWLDPETGTTSIGAPIQGGGRRVLTPSVTSSGTGDAVLFLYRSSFRSSSRSSGH